MGDTPYTRINWNEIIQDINNLATNPNEGCDPLETIEEVSANHIWAKGDVLEVQAKLIEICPDNEFTDLEEIWLTSTIDEIEEAIAIGWCGCVPESEELLRQWIIGWMYGTATWGYRTRIETWQMPYFPFTKYVKSWLAEYLGAERTAWAIADGAIYTNLYYMNRRIVNNIDSWEENRCKELLKQREIEDYVNELRPKREELISLETQLAACQSDCSSIQGQITVVEGEILELEDKIEIAKAERDDFKSEAEDYLKEADREATISWQIEIGRTHWIPDRFNAHAMIDTTGYTWGLGTYPYENVTRSVFKFRHEYEKKTVRVDSPWPSPTPGWVNFTPSGLPFGSIPFTGGTEFRLYRYDTAEDLYGFVVTYEATITMNISAGYREGDILTLYIKKSKGSRQVAEYNPDPDQ